MQDIVILSAARTAVAKFGGMLKGMSASKLGTVVIQEAIKRAGIKGKDIDEVIMGNVLQCGAGQNPARQSVIYAGLPTKIGAFTVNKVCGSGLKAIILAAQAIKSGDANIIVAGGMENMTRAPYFLEKARSGYCLGDGKLIDSLVHDGLWDVYNDYHMGVTAEIIAEKYGIKREEQDKYALASHQKAIRAINSGQFQEEIVSTKVFGHKKEELIFERDERPLPNTSLEKLSKLKPVFKNDGTVTAGNSSGINDGAAAVVVTSSEIAKKLGLKPLATIKAYSTSGVDPEMVMMSPVPAVKEVLLKANLDLNHIELIELNEAFASQSIAVGKELQLDFNKVNVNGGAIALGHPLGASGARILVTLLYAMKERNARYGLATLCMGGGNGLAMIIEQGEGIA